MKIKVGGMSYDLVPVDSLVSKDKSRILHAEIDYADGQIRYDKDGCPEFQEISFWHETLHAIIEQAGHLEKHDEQVIQAISYALPQIIRDNKDVFDSIKEV